MSVQEKFETLPANVKTNCVIKGYHGFKRDIIPNLSNQEQFCLDNIQRILKLIEENWNTVFIAGSYAAYIEGILKKYPGIIMFMTMDIYEFYEPRQIIEKLEKNKDLLNIKNIKHEHHFAKPIFCQTMYFIYYKLDITFTNDVTVSLMPTIGYDRYYSMDNKYENIYRIVSLTMNQSIHQVALPANSDFLLRINSCKKTDALDLRTEEINSYGSPFSLMYLCGYFFNIFPHCNTTT